MLHLSYNGNLILLFILLFEKHIQLHRPVPRGVDNGIPARGRRDIGGELVHAHVGLNVRKARNARAKLSALAAAASMSHKSRT